MATSPAPTRLDAISLIDHNHVGLASQDVSYCSHPRFCLFLLCIRSFACKKIVRSGPETQPQPPRAGAQSSEPERAREKSEKSETADTRPPCSPPVPGDKTGHERRAPHLLRLAPTASTERERTHAESRALGVGPRGDGGLRVACATAGGTHSRSALSLWWTGAIAWETRRVQTTVPTYYCSSTYLSTYRGSCTRNIHTCTYAAAPPAPSLSVRSRWRTRSRTQQRLQCRPDGSDPLRPLVLALGLEIEPPMSNVGLARQGSALGIARASEHRCSSPSEVRPCCVPLGSSLIPKRFEPLLGGQASTEATPASGSRPAGESPAPKAAALPHQRISCGVSSK